MIAPAPTPGKFGITTQLFKLADDLPKNKQLGLLRQLIGDRISKHLYKVIVEMTEAQQTVLLEHINQSPEIALPAPTVGTDETDASMRENTRKPCLIKASYKIQDQKFKSYLLDISIGGVFIEADTRFPVGRQLLLKFSLPNCPQPITFAGQIIWSSARGFGVKFDNVSELQGDIIKSFVEQKE